MASAEPSNSERSKSSSTPDDAPAQPDAKDSKGRPAKGRKARPPHPVEALLGDSLVNAQGKYTSPTCFVHEDGVIGLYFAANWCPPCRVITPEVARLYVKLREEGKRLEVVFVSFDHNAQSFYEYLAKMPWWAVRYEDVDRKEEIAYKFGIRGIPILIFLDAQSLEVISIKGRDIVLSDPDGLLFPWKDAPDPDQVPCISSESETPSQQETEQEQDITMDTKTQSSRSVADTDTKEEESQDTVAAMPEESESINTTQVEEDETKTEDDNLETESVSATPEVTSVEAEDQTKSSAPTEVSKEKGKGQAIDDGEANGDANGDGNGEGNGKADGDANGEANSDANGDANGDADGEADSDANGDANGDADGEADSDADGEADGETENPPEEERNEGGESDNTEKESRGRDSTASLPQELEDETDPPTSVEGE